MEEKNNPKIIVPRRRFLTKAGTLAAGAALGAGALGLAGPFSSESEAKAQQALPKRPWAYKKLDPEKVRKDGYDIFHNGRDCMEGSFAAIIKSLAAEVGHPYTIIPCELAYYGGGGGMGWGTLCGSVNGSCAAMSLILGGHDNRKALRKAVNEIMGWYSTAPLPTGKTDKFGKYGKMVQSVAGTPLCHASVSNWCKESFFESHSPERSDRCARVTGDTAARAVEILNAISDNTFVAVYVPPASVSKKEGGCRSCHGRKGTLANSRGLMDCVKCHEPHEI